MGKIICLILEDNRKDKGGNPGRRCSCEAFLLFASSPLLLFSSSRFPLRTTPAISQSRPSTLKGGNLSCGHV